MSLLSSQRRRLRDIERSLVADDPDLADLFTLFSVRAPAGERPLPERVTAGRGRAGYLPGRRRPASSWLVRRLAPQLIGLLLVLLVSAAACIAAAIGTVKGPARPCQTLLWSRAFEQPALRCPPPRHASHPAG